MKELLLETIGELDDGFAGHMINNALAAMLRDVEDRGDDEKPRKTVITITAKKLEPRRDAIVINVDAKNTIPAYKVAGTVGNLIVTGNTVGAEFNENNPENPDQKTIYDAE